MTGTLKQNTERREAPRRATVAQSTVTAARRVVTWPGRIGRALVSVIACGGAWFIGQAALKNSPIDKGILLIGLGVFAFGTAFAFPETFVRTLKIGADAWDAVRTRRPSNQGAEE